MTAVARSLASLIAGPARCIACDTPGADPLCERCRDRIAALPRLDNALFVDTAPISRLIRRAKTGHCRVAVAVLGEAAIPRLEELADVHAITHIEPDRWRTIARGNWCLPRELAHQLAQPKLLGVPHLHLLRRAERAVHMQGHARDERAAGTEGLFFARTAPGRYSGRRVLLLDDVRTSGATLRAASSALSQAGWTPIPLAIAGRR